MKTTLAARPAAFVSTRRDRFEVELLIVLVFMLLWITLLLARKKGPCFAA